MEELVVIYIKYYSECSEESFFSLEPWASEGGGGPCPLDFEMYSKKGCFLSFEWEKNFTIFRPPGKILEKSLSGSPPGKNPFDTHVWNNNRTRICVRD